MAKKQPKYLQKKPLRRKEPGIGYVIPFFVVMAVLTVVSFIIPLRPTVSYIEKRSLAEFPEFSMEAFTSGDYFDDFPPGSQIPSPAGKAGSPWHPAPNLSMVTPRL